MNTRETVLQNSKVDIALERLELFLEKGNQELLDELGHTTPWHLSQLSKKLRRSPGKIKKQLDRLKEAGFIYSPKRYPKGYAVNSIKCLKVGLSASVLAKEDL